MVTAQLLQRREHDAAECHEATRKIVETCRDLDALLTSSASFGTVAEAPDTLLRPMPFSTLIQGVLLEVRPLIETKGVELCVNEPPDCKVPSGLRWILRELLINAVRFNSAEKPRIQMELKAQAGQLTALVTDNGTGIPVEFAEQVFQPYWRLHPQETHPGCGLGLATARRIATVCHGAVELVPVDSGAAVRVTCPFAV